MQELNDFFNDGFGWVCRHCDRTDQAADSHDRPSRLITEGEAESKTPELTNKALAKWADPAQRILTCPRCGTTELVDIA
jgi:rubrerythrin